MSATIPELSRGFTDGPVHRCLSCKTEFVRGRIYDLSGQLADAEFAATQHVRDQHGGPVLALLGQGKAVTGLSDVQRQVVEALAGGATDPEIAVALGGRSASTVRNHRFQLRRRHQQAQAFVALMSALEAQQTSAFVEYHPSLPVADDRAVVTTDEAEKLLDKLFEDAERTRLIRFPKKEKHKLVVLRHLVQRFEHGHRYTEKQVNAVLTEAFDDYAVLRRWLVDYRFLARERDGSAYWRADG